MCKDNGCVVASWSMASLIVKRAAERSPDPASLFMCLGQDEDLDVEA